MQLVNVASLPEYQNVLKELRSGLESWRSETKDNTPENLTKDWFDRETGKSLGTDKQIRVEMPGNKSTATLKKPKPNNIRLTKLDFSTS